VTSINIPKTDVHKGDLYGFPIWGATLDIPYTEGTTVNIPYLETFCNETFHELRFRPSKTDPFVWTRPSYDGTSSEYITVHVDEPASTQEIAFAVSEPEELVYLLTRASKVEQEDVGPISINLGSNYSTENVYEEDPQVTDVSSDPSVKSDDDPDTVKVLNYATFISNALVMIPTKYKHVEKSLSLNDILGKHWKYKEAKEASLPPYWQGETRRSIVIVHAEEHKKSDEKPP